MRDVQKAKLTRFKTHIEEFDEENGDIDILHERLIHIQNAYETFCEVQDQIEQIDDSEEQQCERVNFEEAYMKAVRIAKGFIRRRKEGFNDAPARQ